MSDEDAKRKCLFNDCESQGPVAPCCLYCEEAEFCDDRCPYTAKSDCVWRVYGIPKKEMR